MKDAHYIKVWQELGDARSLLFDSTFSLIYSTYGCQILKAKWRMWKVGQETDTASWITSDKWVSFFKVGQKMSSEKYEQLIPEYGISVNISQVDFPMTDGITENFGFIDASMEFDDIRIGVTDFELTFGSKFKFTGTIYIATGGAKFLPGKPISASITDRTTGEVATDTEAMRLSIDFGDDGRIKGFIFEADTMRVLPGARQ